MTGRDLRAARKRLGLTAEGLATALKMPGRGPTVTRWERGENRIPGTAKLAVAMLLKEAEAAEPRR